MTYFDTVNPMGGGHMMDMGCFDTGESEVGKKCGR